MISGVNTYSWLKDKNSKFISCCEGIAQLADVDSPSSLIGKSDYDLPWKDRAEFYLAEDEIALSGDSKKNYQLQKTKKGVIKIIVSKCPLLDKNAKIVGTMGSSIDITDIYLTKKEGFFDEKGNLCLGESFGYQVLTKRELSIFKYLLLGCTSKKIAYSLSLSPRTIDQYVDSLKHKLCCTKKSDITELAIKFGFLYLLDDLIKV